MARKKKRRSGKSITRTMFKLLPVAALFAPAASELVKPISMENKISGIVVKYTGWDIVQNRWMPEKLAGGWMPYITTKLIIKGVQKLGGIIQSIYNDTNNH